MSRWRGPLGAGVIVALAVAVWAALSSGEDEPIPEAAPVTTTTASTETIREASSSTQSPSTSTSTSSTSIPPSTATSSSTTVDAAARTEEVRLILQDLYYRWFDAIYRNDEEAALGVVATRAYLDAFHVAVEQLDLPSPPTESEIVVEDVEVLRDAADCLVTYSVLDLTSWRGELATTSGVNVLLMDEGRWKFGTSWSDSEDLWEPDCEIEPDL